LEAHRNLIKIDIKPLSVNEAWRGRRFKTDKYKQFERDLMFLLPGLSVPEGELFIQIEWGLSSKSADIDNPLKSFLDILQKKYSFNDKEIMELIVTKKHVSKGEEYIKFKIKPYLEPF